MAVVRVSGSSGGAAGRGHALGPGGPTWGGGGGNGAVPLDGAGCAAGPAPPCPAPPHPAPLRGCSGRACRADGGAAGV